MGLFQRIHEFFTLKEFRAYVYREQMLTEQWLAAISYGNQEERQRLQELIWRNHKAYRDKPY